MSADDVEALKLALKAEQESYDLYSKSAKETPEPEAQAMFKYLAAEEIGHYRLLDSALDYLGRTSTFFFVEEQGGCVVGGCLSWRRSQLVRTVHERIINPRSARGRTHGCRFRPHGEMSRCGCGG